MSNRGKKNTKTAKDVENEVDENLSEESTQKGGKSRSKSKNTQNRGNSKTPSKTASKGKAQTTKGTSNSKSSAVKGKKQSGGSKTNKKSNVKAKEGSERYFKLIDPKTNKSYGRYTGDTPKQAASKGFTKMLQKLKQNNKTPPKQSTIYLRESTRGSARKVYGYEASRQKLDAPQELKITDKETGEEKTIVYHFRNKIKKVQVPEQIGGAKVSRSSKKSTPKGSKKASNGKTTNKKDTNTKSKTTNKKSVKASGSKKGSTGKSAPAKKSQGAKANSSR
jgi:hypothetical protein